MEHFGRAKEGFLRQFLRLEHGMPSHDAFSNLFRALDPAGLHGVLQRVAKDWVERLGGEVVAVDGKLVLGPMEVDGRSHEIPALPELLDVQGRMVTGRRDAYPTGDLVGGAGERWRLCAGVEDSSEGPARGCEAAPGRPTG